MVLKSESLAKLAPALLQAQKNMGVALKDAKNPFFKSKFADLNAIIDASVPVLNAEGIAVLQTPAVNSMGVGVIQTVLLHSSGEYIASETLIQSAKPNDPQALGSAMSYARRYGLQATVTIKAEDDDGESAMDRLPKINPSKDTPVGATSDSPKSAGPKASTAPAPAASKPKPSFANRAKPTTSGDDI